MALKQQIETKQGVTVEYWTIFYQCILNGQLQINLAGYVNEQAYLDGKEPVEKKQVSIPMDKTATINWGDLYSIVKQNSEEFADSADLK